MYRPFIKNIVPGKKSEIDKRRAFPIPQTGNFFARTVFWSGSKMCAPTWNPLWKYVINLTNRSSNIYCPFSKSFSFFLTTLIGSARFHMIFLLSCTYYALASISSMNLMKHSSSQLKTGQVEHVGMVGGYPNLLLSETLSAQIMF